MAPLPPDLMTSQLSTIDLLTAMFPSPGELDLDASTAECIDKVREWCEASPSASPPSGIPSSILLAVHAPLSNATGKTIQVNVCIPMHSHDGPAADEAPAVTYSLRQPEWMSKAEAAKLSSAMPAGDVFAALEFIQEEGAAFLERPDEASASEQPSAPAERVKEPLVRVWFYFPSLSTRAKRADMVNYAPDYALTGFVLAGKPGVLCLEGTSRDIDSYMSFIKTHSWGDIPAHQKKVSERFRETERVERVFGGMEEITDSLGERGGQRANRGDMQALEAWLGRRGLGEAFEKVIF
ncbi:ubiquitin-conjugating enzyme/RWD-like protein [Aspergillus recurvatus]